jgi:hypothetical protein
MRCIHVADAPLPGSAVRRRQHLSNDLGIGGGLEHVALLLQVVAQHRGVHQVAVMAQSQGPAWPFYIDGLGIFDTVGPGGGVARVPGGDIAR